MTFVVSCSGGFKISDVRSRFGGLINSLVCSGPRCVYACVGVCMWARKRARRREWMNGLAYLFEPQGCTLLWTWRPDYCRCLTLLIWLTWKHSNKISYMFASHACIACIPMLVVLLLIIISGDHIWLSSSLPVLGDSKYRCHTMELNAMRERERERGQTSLNP